MKKKSPYVIQIVNNSDKAIEFVEIGASYINRMKNNFGQDENIIITSLVQGVCYKEFLAHSEKHPFEAGKTIIKSTSPGQLDRWVMALYPFGEDIREHIINPKHEKQTDQLIDNHEYPFNGSTRLRFQFINGNAAVKIYLYPNH